MSSPASSLVEGQLPPKERTEPEAPLYLRPCARTLLYLGESVEQGPSGARCELPSQASITFGNRRQLAHFQRRDLAVRTLEVIARHPAPINLMLVDLAVPDVCPELLASQFVETRPAAAVVYLAASADSALSAGLIVSHASRVLRKPFGYRAPMDALRRTTSRAAADYGTTTAATTRRGR